MRRHVLLIVLALLVAGCTAPQPPGQSDGDGSSSLLTPRDGLSLSTTFSTTDLVQGESLTVDIVAENTGQAEATLTDVRTFGASIFVESCSLRPSVSEDSPVRLAGVLPEAEQAGDQERFTMTCDPDPGLGDGQSDTFRLGTAMTYGYSTTARSSTTVLPRTESSAGSSAATDNTAGPVHAVIHLDSPTPVDADGERISVPIDIRNVGGGEVVGDVDIDVSLPGGSAVMGGCSASSVELFDGSRSISCDVIVPGSSVTSAGTQLLVAVDLDYTYEERFENTITVRN